MFEKATRVAKNVGELHTFLYPKNEEYKVSVTVKDIAREIAEMTGQSSSNHVE